MTDYGKLPDIELLALLQKRDQVAYAEIYNRYWALLYRHALRMLGNEGTAGDIVQDIYMFLWDKATELPISSTLSSYLYATVRNKIINHWKREQIKERYIGSLGPFIEPEQCKTDFLVREKELRNYIESEIAALPENMRMAFELSRNDNMTYAEIAEKLGVSESVVRNNVSRALKILRAKFGDLAILYFVFNNW